MAEIIKLHKNAGLVTKPRNFLYLNVSRIINAVNGEEKPLPIIGGIKILK